MQQHHAIRYRLGIQGRDLDNARGILISTVPTPVSSSALGDVI